MDANTLIKVYVKIRDAKAAKTKEMEVEIAALDEQLSTIETELLPPGARSGLPLAG